MSLAFCVLFGSSAASESSGCGREEEDDQGEGEVV